METINLHDLEVKVIRGIYGTDAPTPYERFLYHCIYNGTLAKSYVMKLGITLEFECGDGSAVKTYQPQRHD